MTQDETRTPPRLRAPGGAPPPAPGAPDRARHADVVIVVPTRNEADNVGVLARRLRVALRDRGHSWRIVFVDDSDDDTPGVVRRLAGEGFPVRVLHRPAGQRSGGLAGAVAWGVTSLHADAVVIMDGDLQHPPELVPAMVELLLSGTAQVAVATRYLKGAEAGPGLAGVWRRSASQAARYLCRAMFARVRKVSDPCSGFFAFDPAVIEGVDLRPEGFKILMEILVRGTWSSLVEVPYLFDVRHGGKSKASLREGAVFVRHLVRLRTERDVVGGSPPEATGAHWDGAIPAHGGPATPIT